MKRTFLILLALIFSACGTGGVLDTGDATSSEITDGATGVSASGSYSFTFPKAVRPETVTTDSFYIASVAAGAGASVTKIPFTLSLSKGEHSVVSVHGSTGSPRTDNPEKGTVPFFKSFNPTTCTTSNRIPGTVSGSSDNRTFTYTTTSPLQGHTQYAMCIKNTIISTDGVPYIGSTITFTTGLAVNSISPERDATGVGLDTTISATFSAAVSADSVTTSSFSVSAGGQAVAGTIALDDARTIATLTPSTILSANTEYTITLASEIQDDSGNALSSYTSTFTTTLIEDKIPPEFSGVTSAVTDSSSEITLSWSAAYDNVTPASKIIYFVYQAATSGGESYTTATYTTDAGITSYQATGLSAFTTYYFVVRAMDESGNIDTNTEEISAPTRTANLPAIVVVSSPCDMGADGHVCAVTSAGDLYCWGGNSSGELGDNTTTTQYSPELIGSGWTTDALGVGASHTCGIKSGAPYCWGLNTSGQIGDGTITQKKTPTQVSTTSTNWTAVTGGNSHTCGIKGGTLWCWGSGIYGQLGDGQSGLIPVPHKQIEPTQETSTSTNWAAVSAGTNHTCGIKGGELYCWGLNGNGQLGDDTSGPGNDKNIPTVVYGGDTNWTVVSAGTSHTCGIKGGTLWCWGSNSSGQLGDNTTTQEKVPTQENSKATDWTAVSAGLTHTCGIKGGELYCWGDNSNGQLGIGSVVSKLVPTRVGSSTNWLTISASGSFAGSFTVGMTDDSSVYSWGEYSDGKLGREDIVSNVYTPTQVGADLGW